MIEKFEEIPPLSPLGFFHVSHRVPYISLSKNKKKNIDRKFLLPSTETLSSKKDFAKIYMGWNEEGIVLIIDVHQPFSQASFPAIEKGDGLEIFIDTRPGTARSISKFCHHFIFLPKEENEVTAKEITKFRMEDNHELADPALLINSSEFLSVSYTMHIHIHAEALHGFDPQLVDQIGFCYTLHRKNGSPQTFSEEPEQFQVAKNPQLWANCTLVPQ